MPDGPGPTEGQRPGPRPGEQRTPSPEQRRTPGAGTGAIQESQPSQTTREKLRAMAQGKDSTIGIVSAKATIGGDGRREEDVLEREAKMQAQSEVTETRDQWAGRPEGEDLSTRDRIVQTLRRAVPRWWNHSVNQLNTYVRTKEHAHQLLASSGLTMQNIPDGFRTMLSNSAQEYLNNNRDQQRADAQTDRDTRRQTMTAGERARDRVQELSQRIGRNQRELRTTEVQIMDNLRNSLARQAEINDATNTDPAVVALRQFVNNPDNAQLIAAYRGVRSGDFQASQGLAQRLGANVPNEAIREAITIGEKRATEVVDENTGERRVKQIEMTGPMADFFKNDVIIPMLQEGVANGGTFDPDRLMEFQLRIQEKFRSRDFVEWRRTGLSDEERSNLDESLSYGTNIIPMVQEVLLPDLLTMKDEMESSGNVDDYIKEMVLEDIKLKTTVGTLQSGEQGTVDETRLQARYARNVEAQRLFKQIEAEGDQESAAAYTSALTAANERRGVLFPSLATDPNLAGMAAGIGTYFATRALGRTASIFAPGVGAGVVAGTVRGFQERSRFNQEAQFHARQAARGEQFDPQAARRQEMIGTEVPMRNIQESATALTNASDQLRRLIDGETITAQEQNTLLEATFGSLVDASVRRNIMDANPAVEMYRAPDITQPMDPLRTNLEMARFQAAATLREYAVANPQAIQDFAQRLGIADYATATVDTVFDPLQYALRANIMRGAEIGNAAVRSNQEVATIRRTLGTSVDAADSIEGRQQALAEARRRAVTRQAVGTFAFAVGGSLAIQGLSEAATDAKNFITGGSSEVQPAPPAPPTEASPTPGLHDADIADHRVRIPDGTQWVDNADGTKNLVVSSNPDQVLISDATIGPDGGLIKSDIVDGFDIVQKQKFVDAPTSPVDLPFDGATVNLPEGMHIQTSPDGTMELALNESNVVLGSVNPSTGEVFTIPGITKDNLGVTVESGFVPVEHRVLGPEGVWDQHATDIDRIDWYGNDTRVSDGNELRLHTLKDGDGSLVIQMQDMAISSDKDLSPSEIDVQQTIDNGEAQIRMSLAGDENNSIVVNANDVMQDKNGNWVAGLKLNPEDKVNMVTLGNGEQITQAELASLMVNKKAFGALPAGDFASEMNTEHRNVFALGGPGGGGMGEISGGKMVTQPDGTKVWQSFNTIFGTGATAESIDVPTEHTTITIHKVPQDVLEITGHLPDMQGPGQEIDLPSEAPLISWITTPFMPRRPLERGGYQRPTETGITAAPGHEGQQGSEEETSLFGPRVDTILTTLNLPTNLYEADGTTPKPEVRDLLTNFLRDKYTVDAAETAETRTLHLDQAADMFSEGYNRLRRQRENTGESTEPLLTTLAQRESLVNIMDRLDLQLSRDEIIELVGLYQKTNLDKFVSDYESDKAEAEKELRFQAELYKAYKGINALAVSDQALSETERNEQNFNRLASQAGVQALRDLNVPGVFEADGTTPKPEAVAIVERLLTQDLRELFRAEGTNLASTTEVNRAIIEAAEMFTNFYTDYQALQAGQYTPQTQPTQEQKNEFITIFGEANPQLSATDLNTLADMFGATSTNQYITEYARDKDTTLAQAKFWGDALAATKELSTIANAPEAPKSPGQRDPLVERMRTESTVQTTPQTLASYLHNNVSNLFGPGTTINDLGMEFNTDNKLVLSGNFSMNGDTFDLNGATFTIDDQGQLELDGEIDWGAVDDNGGNLSKLNDAIIDLNNRLKTTLSAQVQNGREVDSFARGDDGELQLVMEGTVPPAQLTLTHAAQKATSGQSSSSHGSSGIRGIGRRIGDGLRKYKRQLDSE